jgi:hypothetical protein
MVRHIFLWVAATLLVGTGLSIAQSPLPLVEEVPAAPLRAHGRHLLQAAEATKGLLPAATAGALRNVLEKGEKGADPAEAVQGLLDPLCLVGITVNPESRVKAARGPAEARLRLNQDAFFLVRVFNEAGITHALAVGGPQVVAGKKPGPGQWLEAAVVAPQPLRPTLGGERLEYVVLRLRAREAGKREATLRFDAGQGTEDLGFRAEVPILFAVEAGKK